MEISGEDLAERFRALSGGIRIQVRNDKVTEAKEIIAAFERGDFEMN